MILIRRDSDFSLTAAANYLAGAASLRGVRVEHPEANRLHLFFDEWRLVVCLEDYPWVEEECRGIVEDFPFPDSSQAAELARCRSRLTVWSEDPDPDMDHFNDWLLSVECLTGRFRGLTPFDSVAGEWWV